ncbi:MAG: PAS domain S-box protein [Pedobacter sp.]|nr:MAG: PAS domain S-box protein [Pedobacter sp.]
MAAENNPIIPVEQHFKIMADSAPVLIWIAGPDKLCYFFNASWLRFTGRTLEQEYGNGWAEGIHPDDAKRCMEIYSSSFDARESFKMEYRLKRHDGVYRWVVDTGVPRYATDGEFAGYIGSCTDIDELLESTRFRESASENRFKNLVEQAPVAILVFSGPDLVIDLANEAMLELLHKDKSIIGKPLLKGLPEIEGAPAVDQLFHVFRTGEVSNGSEEPVPIMRNGKLETRYFNFSYLPIFEDQKIDGVMDVAVEVTDQVLARKTAETSEKHFRSLADIVPAKISNALPSGEVTFFNQHWLDYSGMSFEDLRDFGYHQMMHPEEIPIFQARLAQAAAKGWSSHQHDPST